MKQRLISVPVVQTPVCKYSLQAEGALKSAFWLSEMCLA